MVVRTPIVKGGRNLAPRLAFLLPHAHDRCLFLRGSRKRVSQSEFVRSQSTWLTSTLQTFWLSSLGSSRLTHRSRHCASVRPLTLGAASFQSRPTAATASRSCLSSSAFHRPRRMSGLSVLFQRLMQ